MVWVGAMIDAMVQCTTSNPSSPQHRYQQHGVTTITLTRQTTKTNLLVLCVGVVAVSVMGASTHPTAQRQALCPPQMAVQIHQRSYGWAGTQGEMAPQQLSVCPTTLHPSSCYG